MTSCGVIWARGKAKTEREGPLLFLNGEQETLKYIYWIGFFLFAQTESFFDLKNKSLQNVAFVFYLFMRAQKVPLYAQK